MRHVHRLRFGWVLLVGPGLLAIAAAQGQESPASQTTVQWTATLTSAGGLRAGSAAVLELSGQIQEGWHVYALTQPEGGPTALRVTVDDNQTAQAAGEPSGTTPQKKRDRSFGLETRFYTHS